jgi:hypothetical protein
LKGLVNSIDCIQAMKLAYLREVTESSNWNPLEVGWVL